MVATSTRPEPVSLRDLRRNRVGRRIGLAAIGLVVLLGALNLLGVRQGVVEASDGDTKLRLEYPHVVRSGLAIRWALDLHHPGGFDGPVTIATSLDYFDRFDFNEWYPEPTETRTRGDELLLTFPAPRGDDLLIRLDGRFAPPLSLGVSAVTSVDTPGLPALEVSYTTRVVP